MKTGTLIFFLMVKTFTAIATKTEAETSINSGSTWITHAISDPNLYQHQQLPTQVVYWGLYANQANYSDDAIPFIEVATCFSP